ncbi:MAG: CRISPR-associated endonuclease Cas1 [Actinomycetota bacterium]
MELDPELGAVDSDKRGRDSLVMDMMETSRPAVDSYPSSDPSERPTTARSTFGNGRRCGPAP